MSDLPIVESRDGVPWWEAPAPPRWHRCSAQTSGRLTDGLSVERCACGAIRLHGRGSWLERNRDLAPIRARLLVHARRVLGRPGAR